MNRAEVFFAEDRSRNAPIWLRRLVVQRLAVLLSFAIAQAMGPNPSLFAADKKESNSVSAPAGLPLTEEQKIFHLLNRLGFGPRPGDAQRVRRMGIERYIQEQLHPETIPDAVVDPKLADLATLGMSTGELLAAYPPPNQEQLRRMREMPEAKEMETPAPNESGRAEKDSDAASPGPGDANAREEMEMRRREGRERMMNGPQRVVGELAQAKLLRAVYSDRQLFELMVDFWENHFNVFAGKGADRWLVTSYDRDVIRLHAMGKFKELLLATAKSPAMLFYLDNWMSTRPDFKPEEQGRRRRGRLGRTFPSPRPEQQQPPSNRRGLNENYARELMELHSLGVNGGYTQQDVVEVARCFTGWTLQAPRREAEFYFNERMHDPGMKHVLGHKIHEGGMKDGLKVLDILARHPSTAKFISMKLARRFVSDEPPSALVERMAQTFQNTDGDIRKILETMFHAPEFWSPESYRAKIKRPLELVASAVRAVGADITPDITNAAPGLLLWIARMGEPLFLCQPPTGYSDLSSAWVNTGALLQRMNFATALAAGRIQGTRVSLDPLLQDTDLTDPEKVIERGISLFLGNDVSPGTRAALEQHASDPEIVFARLDDPRGPVHAAAIFGLVLGAPEFQRK